MCFCTLQVTSLNTGEILDYGTENIQWILSQGSNSTIYGSDPATKLDVVEDIDTLLSFLSGTFVKVNTLAYGDIAVNKYYVKKLSQDLSGKGVVFTTTNLAFYLTDDYATIRPLFANCGTPGSVTVDGVTIINPGDVVQVGTITGANIQDGTVLFADIEDIDANRILGRTLTDGVVQELIFFEGDGIDIVFGGGFLRFENVAQGELKAEATGLLIWDSRNVDNHVFKGLLASTGIDVSEVGSDIVITNTGLVSASSVGGGTIALLSGVVSGDVQLKTITAGPGIGLVDAAGNITISATGGVTNATNVGVGQGIFKQLAAGILEFYSLVSSGAISISLVGDDVQISEVLTASNGLTRTVNDILLGGTLNQNTVIGGASSFNFQLTNLVAFTASGTGSGSILFNTLLLHGITGVTIRASGSGNPIDIGTIADEVITLGNTLGQLSIAGQYELPLNDAPDSTMGVKEVLVWTGDGGGGSTVQFEPFVSGGITSVVNVGGGNEILRDIVANTANLRTLIAAGGISITQNADDITIGDLFTAVGGLTRSTNAFRLGGIQDQNVLISGAGFNFTLNGQNSVAMTAVTDIVLTSALIQLLAADVELGTSGATVRVADNYDLPSGAPSTTAGEKNIMVWTGDGGGGATPAFESLNAGASAFAWEDISVDPGVAEGFMVRCTDPTGITLTKPSPTEFLVTVPTGIDITDVAIHLSAVHNPGSDLFFQVDFQGNSSKGVAREAYQDLDSLTLPTVKVANKQLAETAGLVSRTNYIQYGRTQGSGVLEVRLTGLAPLELYLINFNQANAAGNAECMLTVSDL